MLPLRCAQGFGSCAQHDSVWITDIMTQFTLIVSTASKPLTGLDLSGGEERSRAFEPCLMEGDHQND